MMFEEMILRPISGAVDVPAVADWLDAQPYVFRDPVDGDGWHLSASPAEMARNRQERLDHPRRFPLGVRVRVAPDHVWLAARADRDVLARALAFVQWLTRAGGWTAEVDGPRVGYPSGGELVNVGDARQLFPPNLPESEMLDDNRAVPPVLEGKLVRWNVGRDRAWTFAIHSSGVWRYYAGGSTLRGRLRDDARDAWNAALASIDTEDPELSGPAGDTTVLIELWDSTGLEDVELDTAAPPAAYRPLIEMVTRWTTALANHAPHPDLLDIREG